MLHGRGKSIAPSREAINVQLAVLPTNNSINDSTTSPDLPINVFPFFYFSLLTIPRYFDAWLETIDFQVS